MNCSKNYLNIDLSTSFNFVADLMKRVITSHNVLPILALITHTHSSSEISHSIQVCS